MQWYGTAILISANMSFGVMDKQFHNPAHHQISDSPHSTHPGNRLCIYRIISVYGGELTLEQKNPLCMHKAHTRDFLLQ